MFKSKKKNKSLLLNFFKLITYLFLCIFFISYLCRYIPPDISIYAAFLSLIFPFLYVLALLLFIIWLLFRQKISIYIGLVLIISFHLFIKFFNIFPVSNNITANSNGLKVISFNVRLFNRYNHKKDVNKFLKRNEILTFIQNEKPDIICLQEAYFNTENKYKTIDSLVQIQEATETHSYFPFGGKEHKYGIATLTKYPIIKKGEIKFSKNIKNPCIYTDIKLLNDTVRIYNAHFASIGISTEDFFFIESLNNLNFEDSVALFSEKSWRKIASQLKKAYLKRTEQIRIVTEHIAACNHPIILCTDLNDTPSSYAYYKLSKNLNDAFLKSGKGIGKTYNGILPYLRIDYIFYSKHFTSSSFKTHQVNLSDHFPISTELFLNN